MSSQLVVVDLTKGGRKIDFSELTQESPDTLMFYVGEEHELAHLHQFSYNREYRDWPALEFRIWWDDYVKDPKPVDYVENETEAWIRKLCRQYEVEIGTYMKVVKHFGPTTIVEFEANDAKAPLKLDWTRTEPPKRET
ncbi:hypothetical protein D3C78_1477270 [compost metagenome]